MFIAKRFNAVIVAVVILVFAWIALVNSRKVSAEVLSWTCENLKCNVTLLVANHAPNTVSAHCAVKVHWRYSKGKAGAKTIELVGEKTLEIELPPSGQKELSIVVEVPTLNITKTKTLEVTASAWL